jgi:hypothetical protein
MSGGHARRRAAALVAAGRPFVAQSRALRAGRAQ